MSLAQKDLCIIIMEKHKARSLCFVLWGFDRGKCNPKQLLEPWGESTVFYRSLIHLNMVGCCGDDSGCLYRLPMISLLYSLRDLYILSVTMMSLKVIEHYTTHIYITLTPEKNDWFVSIILFPQIQERKQ